ncbi:MAG: hypothetical protein J6O55_09065, partial [Lachnospiraceae bacterium]|nr:hypothetical protein [Lachnospiraceae bacterium]
ARIQTISGAIMVASGFLGATGILAPLGGVLGLIGTAVNIGFGLFYSRHRKNLTKKAAVDDFLNLESKLQIVRNANGGLANLKDKEVIQMMRQEALGQMGYATYKECFADLMKQNAHLLYDQVFNRNRDTDPDWPMYHDALKSLGMKIKLPAEPGGAGAMPTEAAIYAKLMK